MIFLLNMNYIHPTEFITMICTDFRKAFSKTVPAQHFIMEKLSMQTDQIYCTGKENRKSTFTQEYWVKIPNFRDEDLLKDLEDLCSGGRSSGGGVMTNFGFFKEQFKSFIFYRFKLHLVDDY